MEIINDETGATASEVGFDLFDDAGKPITIWVFNEDGTYFSAMNRVWREHLTEGRWSINDGYLYFEMTMPAADPEQYRLVEYVDNKLSISDGENTLVLKRLDDADKYTQLQSIEFTNYLATDGKLHIDPRIGLTNGTYELFWKYTPKDYEPYDELVWTSSNPEVATVEEGGKVRPAEGVTSGETTITLTCDCVKAEIVVVLEVIN